MICASSDFHMSVNKKNDFRSDEEFFKCYLYLEKDDIYVLNGDILDLWESSPESIYEQHKHKIDIIRRDPRIILIPGNHDEGLRDKCIKAKAGLGNKSVKSPRIINKNMFIHGHELDKIISKYPTLAKIASFVGGQIERFIPSIDAWFRDLRQRISSIGRYGPDRDYAIKAICLAKVFPADINKVILGHTHSRYEAKYKDIKYVNLGACTGNKFNFIKIE